jgi:predicted Zn-dependent protease
MRFRLQFPDGWSTTNRKDVVGATSPGQDAVVVLTLSQQGSPAAAASDFARQQGVRAGTAQRAEAGGLPAVEHEFAAATGEGELRGLASFVEHGGRVFRILGYTSTAAWSRYDETLERSVGTFRRLDDPRYLNVEAMRLDVVPLPGRMSVRDAVRRYPSSEPVETVAILNQAEPGDELPAGTLFKRVVGGRKVGSK